MGVEVSLWEWGKGDKSGNGLLRLSTIALTLPWSCLCSSVFHKHCPRACSLNRSQGSLENTAYYIFLKFNRWNISEKSSHRTTCLSLLIDQFSMLLDQGTFFFFPYCNREHVGDILFCRPLLLKCGSKTSGIGMQNLRLHRELRLHRVRTCILTGFLDYSYAH